MKIQNIYWKISSNTGNILEKYWNLLLEFGWPPCSPFLRSPCVFDPAIISEAEPKISRKRFKIIPKCLIEWHILAPSQGDETMAEFIHFLDHDHAKKNAKSFANH